MKKKNIKKEMAVVQRLNNDIWTQIKLLSVVRQLAVRTARTKMSTKQI